jgi:hypothetical protein
LQSTLFEGLTSKSLPQPLYAVVLPSGSVVEPMLVRKSPATAALVDRDALGNFLNSRLATPAGPVEIHGEISFSYGFGKGSGWEEHYLNPALEPPPR